MATSIPANATSYRGQSTWSPPILALPSDYSNYDPPQLCGYVDYNSLGNSYICSGTATCLWNSHLSLVGCGNPTSITFFTSCVPYHRLSLCDSACMTDPSIIRCGSELPHCATPTVGPMGEYSIRQCQMSHHSHDHDDDTDIFKIHLEYDGQTTIGHLPRYLGDDQVVTYATHTPHHHYLWGTDWAAETQTPTGNRGMSEALERRLFVVAFVSIGLGSLALGTAFLAICLAVRIRRSGVVILTNS